MISIIIPAYNSEKTIARTLKSIQIQTYTDYEVLVLNDGSTDNTESIVERIVKADSRIRLITTENQGAYKARLCGIAHSKGEYLTFADADDSLPCNALEVLVQMSTAMTEADILVGTINLNNRSVYKHKKNGVLTNIEYIKAILCGETSVGPYAKLYKSSLFNIKELEIRQRIHQNEDLLMLLTAALNAKTIYINPDTVVYNYIMTANSMTSLCRPLSEWFELFDIIESRIKHIPHLGEALTIYKINHLYTEGVLKINNFKLVSHKLELFRQSVDIASLPYGEQKMLRIICAPAKRKWIGMKHQCVLRIKKTIKKFIGREG